MLFELEFRKMDVNFESKMTATMLRPCETALTILEATRKEDPLIQTVKGETHPVSIAIKNTNRDSLVPNYF